MLKLDPDQPKVTPKDAATLILLRDAAAGVEVFCVERNKASRFMGGNIVFPGGKVDARDADERWLPLTTAPRVPQPSTAPFANDGARLRALAIAACRESLEEAAILPVTGEVSDGQLASLRAELASEPDALASFLRSSELSLDLAALQPFARWITPEAETRRFDARFFAAVAPAGQSGAHDEHETMASFWASPAEVLRRFAADQIRLAPPTHRMLTLIATRQSAAEVLSLAAASTLDPICPRLVPQGQTLALTLPGDPEHEVKEERVPGPSRYVLRGERWRSEDAPR